MMWLQMFSMGVNELKSYFWLFFPNAPCCNLAWEGLENTWFNYMLCLGKYNSIKEDVIIKSKIH